MNRLKVLVDVQALNVPEARRRGAGVASLALTNALLRFAPNYELYLLRQDDSGNWEIGTVPAGEQDAETVLSDPALWVPSDPTAFMANAGVDILYVTCPLIFGFRVPKVPPGVLTASQVHDMVPVVMAGQYLSTWPAHLQADYWEQLRLLREADLLLGSSWSTANDLVTHLKPSGKVQVAYLCAVNQFERMDPLEARRMVRDELRVDRPYILAVTEADPRKNSAGLIDGFVLAGLPSYKLVVAGMFNPSSRNAVLNLAKTRRIANRVITLDFIPHRLMNALYCAAELLVFPSLYEGFGLPSLEAMQSGLPVVAGNNSCFPEVVGEGGLLVNVRDPRALGLAIRHVSMRADVRKVLIEKGLRQAARFSYEQTAEQIKSAFADLVGGRT